MKTFLSFLSAHKKLIIEISFNLVCVILGVFLAMKYLGTSFDIKNETDRIKAINTQISQNNDACIKAVESNKKLKAEYESRMQKVTDLLRSNVGQEKKEVALDHEGEKVPASLPESK